MKRFIKEYLLENWSLKATALLLSLILWMFVRGEPGPERVVAVPLEVQLPPLMVITNTRPTTVEITMRGAAFSNILFSNPLPTCIVDLQGAGEGEHIITLTPENVKIPKGSGIEVLQVNPARVTVVLEKTISKEVDIVVPIQGEPGQGFEIYKKSWKPEKVLVSGPRSHIESVNSVSTDAVSIANQKQSARFFVRLNPSDNMVRAALANPVQVDIQVGPRRKLRTFSRVPVATDDDSYTTVPKHISIQVLAPPEMIKDLTSTDISATVDVKNLDLSKLPAKVKPTVQLPSNLNDTVVIRDVQPSEVAVRKVKGR
jgi:YbbR domain-containing protein